MKRSISLLIALTLFAAPLLAGETISEMQKNDNDLFLAGCGACDGGLVALNTSMLGWGLGLSTAIAVIAASLHQSTATTHTVAHCCKN
jgi:hypothetical protein